jgi:hypothetical protein
MSDDGVEQIVRLARRVAYGFAIPMIGGAAGVGYALAGSGAAVGGGCVAALVAVTIIVVLPRAYRQHWESAPNRPGQG